MLGFARDMFGQLSTPASQLKPGPPWILHCCTESDSVGPFFFLLLQTLLPP